MTPEERAEAILWGGRPLPTETRADIAAAIREAVAEERAQCAKVAEDTAAEYRADAAAMIASEYYGMLLGKADGAMLAAVRIRGGG
jgi:hypothetical protein